MKIEIFYFIIDPDGIRSEVIGKLHKLRSMYDLGEVVQKDIHNILKLDYVSTIEKVEIHFRKLIK